MKILLAFSILGILLTVGYLEGGGLNCGQAIVLAVVSFSGLWFSMDKLNLLDRGE